MIETSDNVSSIYVEVNHYRGERGCGADSAVTYVAMRQLLYLMSGVDLARIDGIDVITATTVVAKAGYDMSPWPTADHFASWLRLAPDNRIQWR